MQMTSEADSIYFNQQTFLCACLAAGGAIEACRQVVLGNLKNAAAIIRPPGHHAAHEKAQGFCIFNNVSIAVRACQKEFRSRCRRILIFDW
jgi:histone deacetylase 6